MLFFILTFSLSAIWFIRAAEVSGRLLSPTLTAIEGITISLNTQYHTISRKDGQFTFFNVPPGVYLMEVQAVHYLFSQCKLKVDENGQITVVEYKYPGAKRIPVAYPIVLTAITGIQYVVPRPPFSLLALIMQNPIIFLGLAFMIIVVAFPNALTFDIDALEEAAGAGTDSADTAEAMETLQKLMGGGKAAKQE